MRWLWSRGPAPVARGLREALNAVDLCFVVDTTGSMGRFIDAAKQHLLATIDRLGAESGLDLWVGLVEYRDHPPQEQSFVTRRYPLTADRRQMQRVIGSLAANGGGDGPEAVLDGVQEACSKAGWRAHSCRFALLVGDSPPHGAGTQMTEGAPAGRGRRVAHQGDAWPAGCPCGLDTAAVTAVAEQQGVTVHALCMGHHPVTVASFTEIAAGSGGQCSPAANASQVVGMMVEMLQREFRDLDLDRRVLAMVRKLETPAVSALAEALGCPRLQAAASVGRLGRRGFLEGLPAAGKGGAGGFGQER